MSTPLQSGATASASVNRAKSTRQCVGFLLNDQEYAFRIEQIQEIVIPDRVTRIPQVPDYVEGVCNLRGTIIPIIRLRRLLNLPDRDHDSETRTIVVNVGPRTMGCTVDSVTQVIRFSPEQLQPAPELVRSRAANSIAGFVKLESRVIVLLEIMELLDPEKLEQVHNAARQGMLTTEST